MIAKLLGTVIDIDQQSIILDIYNMGFEIYVSNPSDFEINQEYSFYIYEHIREDNYLLFGFLSKEDKDLFKLLISVNGVGPKTALNILNISTNDLLYAIQNADSSIFKSISGIGPKTAEKIILELKTKISKSSIYKPKFPVLNDVEAALEALGYSSSDIQYAINYLSTTTIISTHDDINQILSYVLKALRERF